MAKEAAKPRREVEPLFKDDHVTVAFNQSENTYTVTFVSLSRSEKSNPREAKLTLYACPKEPCGRG